MNWLVDTNVLVRFTNGIDPQFPAARDALTTLRARGDNLHLTPQVMIEFRNVATRAKNLNGLGLPAADADQVLQIYESSFTLLDDVPAIYPAWKALVSQLGVIGKQVHDARLAAVCHVHGVQSLLTFNVQHFQRFIAAIPGFQVVDPASV